MLKVFKYLITLLLISSCATKRFVKKEQLQGHISEISETTYGIENAEKVLFKKKIISLTKNGRIKFSKTYNANGELIETIEKKLFFNKKSFPDKAAYYCKTRWKSGNKERISCYSQKKYKQNEIIVQYNKEGSIANIKDNFSSFYTHIFNYSNVKKNNELLNIITLDNKENLVEKTIITCIAKDALHNCIKLEKHYTVSKKIERVERLITYN
jgi:hypothetical protein